MERDISMLRLLLRKPRGMMKGLLLFSMTMEMDIFEAIVELEPLLFKVQSLTPR